MNDRIIDSKAESFEKDVLQAELPVVVYFYSEDCPPCIPLNPIFERMAEAYGDKMKFVKVFRQPNRQLAEKYGVKSSPTLLFFRNGEEVCSRLNGYIGKPELRQTIEGVIGGTCSKKERGKVYCDVLILGAGPAGLSAAIYTARAKLYTVIIDESLPGGQVSTTFHIANYPGTNGVIRGIDLVENMKKQATDFGAKIDDMKEIQEVNFEGEQKLIKTEDTDYYARGIVIATGAQPRKLPAEGEREFRGRGVHYCATCDGAMYQDANVIVVGGGNSAVDEAVFLTRYAKHVTIIHRLDNLVASKVGQDEAAKNQNISIVANTEIKKVNGENFVKSVTIEDLKTKEQKEIEVDGVFVYIGMEPKTDIFKGKLTLNDKGYIITDEDMKTNTAGVYAAGDVRDKKVRQIATAVSDGVTAGIMLEKFISGK